MARLARVAVPGYPHQVTQRGNGRARTFFSDADYALYRNLLAARISPAKTTGSPAGANPRALFRFRRSHRRRVGGGSVRSPARRREHRPVGRRRQVSRDDRAAGQAPVQAGRARTAVEDADRRKAGHSIECPVTVIRVCLRAFITGACLALMDHRSIVGGG